MSQNKELPLNKKICPDCNGDGYTFFSCCGDNIKGTEYEDIMICPTCHEHIDGMEEKCETCKGTGIVDI